MMQQKLSIQNIISWVLGLAVLTIGILNLILVHAVPGIIGLLLSLLFFPPVNDVLKKTFGFTIPFAVKVILALFIFWFTLGISDLGDMID
jgi:predicted PurR-regulated permease PerM